MRRGNFFVWGNMGSYAAVAVGALALFAGWRLPLLIVWFFAVTGVAGNAIGHPISALISGDPLFPGTVTSFAYWVIGPVLIRRLWQAPRPWFAGIRLEATSHGVQAS